MHQQVAVGGGQERSLPGGVAKRQVLQAGGNGPLSLRLYLHHPGRYKADFEADIDKLRPPDGALGKGVVGQ